MDAKRPLWFTKIEAELASRPEWVVRLVVAIAEHPLKRRPLSVKAGLGPNYLREWIETKWAGAGFDVIVRICKAADVSITYVVTGAKMTPYEEEVLAVLAKMREGQKRHFLEFVRHSLISDKPSE